MSRITDNMHDLVQYFQQRESYHDFEGLADGRAVLVLCYNPKTCKYVWDEIPTADGARDIARSYFLGRLFERADTYGIEDLTYNDVINLWEFVTGMFECRWWSKVTDEDIVRLETE